MKLADVIIRNLYIIKRRIYSEYWYYFKKDDYMPGGPFLEIDTHYVGQFVNRKLIRLVGTSPYPPHELMLMAASVIFFKPKLIVEWGTNIGVSARIFYEITKHFNIRAEIHSIDLPNDVPHIEHPKWRIGIFVKGLPVHLYQGDGPYIAKQIILNRGIKDPLVFIDGDHSKESVIRDIKTILGSSPKAAILVHDTFFQPGSNYNHGPYEAVNEIFRKADGYIIIEQNLGKPGMTLIYPSPTLNKK